MDKQHNKTQPPKSQGIIGVLAVAALCFVVSLIVYQTTTIQMSTSYDNLYAIGAPLPASQRTLLAFAGSLQELETSVEFPVTVQVDGDTDIVMVRGGTVADALFTAGVKLGTYDRVAPPQDAFIDEFDEIVVTRRERLLFSEVEAIPYETFYVYSPQVKAGEEVIEIAGQDGIRTATYARMMVSGDVDEEDLIDQKVTEPPITQKVLMGFRSKPISTYDFEANFSDIGEPLECENVIRNVKAAGYSAGSGAGTASGLAAKVGHVAVNPNVIPYGSKLFIQSTDGNFVYGYAIAADTGSALMRGSIGVDLFYGSYMESVNNGILNVDIFVLS